MEARLDEPAKTLAIALAVRELERITEYGWCGTREGFARAAIENLLIGLGCEAVVRAWEECG